MNFTISNFTVPYQEYSYSIKEILVDVCRQIDDNIVKCMFLILTFYIMTRFMVPVSEKGLSLIMGPDTAGKLMDYACSMLETFSLGAIIYCIVIYFYQNTMTLGYIIWAVILGMIVLLSFILRKIWDIK